MSFGSATLVFTRWSKTGAADAAGNFHMVPQHTEAPGCRHRPLVAKEIAELSLNVEQEWWRSTLPLFEYDQALLDVILGAKGTDKITVGAREFQIHGAVRPHDDLAGNPYKMTIISSLTKG